METKVLEKIGLDKSEVKVYLYLLNNGSSSASEISKSTKLMRTSVYRILEGMIRKGLVSYFDENRVRKFNSIDPQKLLIQLKENQKELELIIPKLKKASSLKKSEPVIEVYRGTKGVKNMVRDILIIKKDYIVFCGEADSGIDGNMAPFFHHLMRSIEKENIHERVLLKISCKIATSRNTLVRFLPKELSFPSVIMVYGDCVGTILLSDPFVAIRITDKNLAETYRSYFELLWGIAIMSSNP